MNTKAKGTNAERELLHLLNTNGFACFRAAGSGSMKYPCPDLIAGNNIRKLAIEVKITGTGYQHLTKKEVEELSQFASLFGAEAWFAVKFKDWFFLTPEDINKTEQNYSVTEEIAQRKGLSFEELIHF